jgi:hypothetical protein
MVMKDCFTFKGPILYERSNHAGAIITLKAFFMRVNLHKGYFYLTFNGLSESAVSHNLHDFTALFYSM